MGRNVRRQRLTLLIGVLALGLLVGCSGARSVERAKVLEAENINLRQKTQTMEQQMRQAHAAQDDAVAREQQLRADLLAAQEDANAAAEARAQAAIARERLTSTQADLDAAEQRLAAATQRYEQLRKQLEARRAPAAPRVADRGPALRFGGASPEIEAMRRDLRQHLASYGVHNLNIEIRTDRTGQQRVAIVLPDAFPPGKATLAYNKSAVSAVMSVGKMIREQYPQSTVLVEGHTDSDPIRKSNWGTNENLSRARARAVETLLTTAGVPGQQVRIEGLGARQPLAAGKTKRAKSRNRRVEIFISPRG